VTRDPTTGAHRRTLQLETECPNRCIFCARDGLVSGGPAEMATALTELRSSADEITFTGPEPSTHPQLLEAVAEANELGFRAIGLQTNATGLDPQRIEALANAGLSDVHLSLHGGSAAVHDYHTGREGSFAEVVRAAEHLRARRIDVVVTTVLTRSNFRVLAPLCDLLLHLRVTAWSIALPLTAGRSADAFDRTVPRLGLAVPFALHALASARARHLPVAVSGAPLCALGPHADLALPSTPRAFTDTCTRCPVKTRCPGVDAAYLERFTDEELRAREPVAHATALSDRIARMFVGVGEIAARAPTLHPAPARIRRSLPVLGKARPAEHETRGRSSVRTGEALRGLFPTLFENED
jgi:hypothetical protein